MVLTRPRKRILLFTTILLAGLLIGSVLSGCTNNTSSEKSDISSEATPETQGSNEEESLLVYAGSASKPPTEEAAQAFEEKTGVKVDLVFGGSGAVLSQMTLNEMGDLYFPGSSDFMEKAIADDLVYADTEEKIVYLASAINVQKGNPKGINNLKDLLNTDLKVAIANPETVCVGLYATEIIDNTFTAEDRQAFIDNLINYTDSCEKTATAISLQTADAVIGWSVFEHWDDAIETVALDASEIQRIGYIPIAISKFTKQQDLAQSFINFLASNEGQDIFKKHGYFVTSDEAAEYIGEYKPVGGEYELKDGWVL